MNKYIQVNFEYHSEYIKSKSISIQSQLGIPMEDYLLEFAYFLNNSDIPYSSKAYDEFESHYRIKMRDKKLDSILK